MTPSKKQRDIVGTQVFLPASSHARREAAHTDKSQTSRVVNPDLDLAETRFIFMTKEKLQKDWRGTQRRSVRPLEWSAHGLT